MNKAILQAHVSTLAPLQGEAPMRRVLLIVLVLVAGLALDRWGGIGGEIATSIIVWAFLFWLLSFETPVWRFTLIVAVAFALVAEATLSIGLGWYDYQFHNVPPFVPPGHILLFVLAPTLARRLPDWVEKAVPVGVGAYGLLAGIAGWGTFDSFLAVIFLAAYARGGPRKTYALMILLALALEIVGTSFGNWAWAARIPYLGLTSTNPPILAGACYAVFDMYIMRTARIFHRRAGGKWIPGERLVINSASQINVDHALDQIPQRKVA